ncbi:MAG: hypothetical protein JSV08_06195 [Acidobacteriota bacterium]|nr:MAG: hypothetical protein JSV08_06195 [Acidobacteriota bacterium]
MSTREKALGVAALIVLLMALWNYAPLLFRGGDDAPLAVARLGESRGAISVESLRIDELEAPRPQYEGAERNLFSFGHIPTPQAVRDEQQEKLQQMREQAARERERKEKEIKKRIEEDRAASGGSVNFVMPFIGYIGPPDDEIAIFRDGKTFIYAKRGEVLKEQFVVVDIGYESVEIRVAGTQQTKRYPLATKVKSIFSK